MSAMHIQDYKGKHTYKTLGLRRGKAVLRQRTVSRKRLKVFLWIGLIALMVFLNYLVFVRLGPLGKKEITIGPILREDRKPDTFEDWFDKGYKKQQQGDLAGAAEAYTRAILLKPEEIKYVRNNRVRGQGKGSSSFGTAFSTKSVKSLICSYGASFSSIFCACAL